MKKVLPIVLTFDVELDSFDESIEHVTSIHSAFSGAKYGVPILENILSEVEKNFEIDIPVTWFIRADNQIYNLTGSHTYLINEYYSRWEARVLRGDEIGFHPHLFFYDKTKKVWEQDLNNDRISEQLFVTFKEFSKTGFIPTASRIGELFFSNEILKTLLELKIECDSTALPGRYRKDKQRHFDWRDAPKEPYYPSIENYRLASLSSNTLLEVPMTTIKTKAHYDNDEYLRYFDLSFNHDIFVDDFKKVTLSSKAIICITHANTILRSDKKHGLLSFDRDCFKINLEKLVSSAIKNNREVRFYTLSKFARNFQ